MRAGITRTPSLERIPGHAELTAWAERYNPHGRITRPEDVAEAIAALSKLSSSWVTGNVIGVDGGENLVL
jgi:enoyl-[acyl-carrier protein] reductase III